MPPGPTARRLVRLIGAWSDCAPPPQVARRVSVDPSWAKLASRRSEAGRLHASVYRRATMYTTLSPCDMCTGAILLYGIPRVVIGENRTFRGDGERYLRSRGVEVVTLDSPVCRSLMDGFIAAYPEIWNEDIGEE